ncbi:MAG: hypothetical protein RLY91_1397, partial [Pseudomonadota bacterium]
MTLSLSRLSATITFLLSLSFGIAAQAQTKPDAMGAPNEFVQQVADQV